MIELLSTEQAAKTLGVTPGTLMVGGLSKCQGNYEHREVVGSSSVRPFVFGVLIDLEVASAPCEEPPRLSPLKLFYGDLGAALACIG
jgi:hypothetical protein